MKEWHKEAFAAGMLLGFCGLLAWCLTHCSAAQQQAERRWELRLVQDCRQVSADGLAPEWVKLECDVADGVAVVTLPRAQYLQEAGCP